MKKLNTNSILLAVLMSMAASVASASNICIDGIYYDFDTSSKTATVTYRGGYSTSYSNEYSGAVGIPETVTYNEEIYSVTSIGNSAFYYCEDLTSVTIPESVISIGDNAFYYCWNLTSITIPYSVTSIGRGAFEGTAWYNDKSGGLIYAGRVVYKYKGTMSEGTEITLEEWTIGIAGSAFSGCGLTSITIPSGLTSIGSYAFSGCRDLTSVTIPESVISIGDNAFSGCTGLTSVVIPNSVAEIGNEAFSGCTGLNKAEFSSIESLCKIKFGSEEWGYIKANPLSYAHHLYIDGKEITGDLVIPENITSIVGCAFSGCTSLTSVAIPENMTSIGDGAFYECTGLTKAEFASLESLCRIDFGWGGNPLYYARHLYIDGKEVTSVVIPESITSIGEYAFEGAPIRNLMVKHSTPPSVGYNSFSEQTYYHTTLYVPADSWDAYAYDDHWYLFHNIRETAMESNNVAPENAYTLMNAKDFTYAVYDPVNDCVGTISSVGVNEDNPNHCWQAVEVSGKQFLYNIGAKKFAVPATDGSSFTLSDTVGSVEMTDGADGIVLNGHTETQWALVLNESMNTDNSVEDVVVTAIENISDNRNDNNSPIYDLNGRRIADNSNFKMQNSKLKRGIYIVNGKKVLVK